MDMKPEYQQTEAGVIPEDWKVFTIGNLIEYTKGYPFKSTEYSSHGVQVVRVSDTSYDAILGDNPIFVPESTVAQYAKWKLRTDDLIISTVGSKPPIYSSMVGRAILVPEEYAGALLNQNAVLIRDKNRRRHVQHILLNHLRTKRYLSWIECIFRGNANQASITLKELFDFSVPLPSVDSEQRAIAETLSDADALIEALEQLLTKKRNIKQGAMQELLTGKKRLSGFSGDWELRRLGDIVQVDPDSLGSDTRPAFTFNYIALEDVDCGALMGYSEQVFQTAPSRARRKLCKGDVLVSTVRPNLKSHLLFSFDSGDWVCSTGFSVLRCREGTTSPSYIFFHLFSDGVSRQIEALLTGSSYPAINSGDVRALQVPMPSYEEQTAIAAIVADMDTEIAALEAKLAKMRGVKQGMMQELLTGRIRLV
jgi:type I restriction enzyme, S subunit